MKNTLFLVLAVISGAMTWFLLTQNQATLENEPSVNEMLPVDVLVVNQALNRGTVIDEKVLAWQPLFADAVPLNAIVRPTSDASFQDLDEQILGRVLRADVYEGELLRSNAVVAGSASFMALAVTPGMRAVAIRIARDELAGGYILPEDRVDIIHTVRQESEDGTFAVSEVILRNVRVLAVGDQATQRTVFQSNEEQQAVDSQRRQLMALGDTITLQLNEAQAKVLLPATQVGSLTLALRAIEDHGDAEVGDSFVRSGGGQQLVDNNAGSYIISLIEGGVERTLTLVVDSQVQDFSDDQ